jgi:hypothetical protein
VVDLKASGIQIVSTIVGSSLLLFAISTFYSDWWNKPLVAPTIITPSYGPAFLLTNYGRVPATNLTLSVHTPANISHYEIISTERWTMKQADNQTLVAQFPRFAQGDGSIILVHIATQISSTEQKPDRFKHNYDAYATFDQGSLRISGGVVPQLGNPFGGTIAFATGALLAFAIPFFYRRAKRDKRNYDNRFVSAIAETIFFIKEICERGHSYYKSSKTGEETADLRVYAASVIINQARVINDLKRLFQNEADFYAVSEFYTETASRIVDSMPEIKKD